MVKPDYSRDYYADLELPGPADAAEIKKQFKKLGSYPDCPTMVCLFGCLTGPDVVEKHSNTIPIGIPARKTRRRRSLSSFKLHTRF